MTMMGGPIDARKSPTAVNNLAMNKSYNWFENNVIYRVPTSFPGAGRRVYPGFLQHTGFVAMNPDRHMSSHYDYFKNLIKGDDASAEAHRKFYDEYNAVLDMDADYYLETIRVVFQEFALVNGTWDVISDDGEHRARAARGHQDHRPLHRRRRAGRHLGLGPDRSRARALLQRAQVAPEAPAKSRAPATTASSAAAAGAKSCIRRCATSSSSSTMARRAAKSPPRRPARKRSTRALR